MHRHRTIAAWRAMAGAALLLAAPLVAPAIADSPPGPVRVVDDALIAGRTRIGARAGDLALVNRSAVAIVRKRDGFLVDFWPRGSGKPTAPQLKLESQVDGLWMVHPTLIDGTMPHVLTAKRVEARGDAIETISEVALGSGTVRVTTRYRLDGDAPRIVIESHLEHTGGGKVTALGVGDAIKWGNVDYFVDGVGRTKPTFSGRGRWVGRKGAGGDLVLRSLEAGTMRIDYKQRHHGLAAEIRTQYSTRTINPGSALTLRRTLGYEPIAEPARKRPLGPTLVMETFDESGHALPSKLSFRGVAGTPDPNFGNDGDEAGAGRFAWSGSGRFVRTLPAGRYRVMATAGIERASQSLELDLRHGENTYLSAKLPRVIDTPGRISADLHLHQSPSVDADIALATRVVSVAAEGVEMAVASDHYAVTDLAPTVAAMISAGALARPILTMVGSEISTVGNRFGHFNLMPMKPGDAIGWVDTTPKQLFAEMRAASPGGLIQVNHPRWDDIGYWHRYKLDPKTSRLPYAYRNEFDAGYDAIEVYNGVDASSEPKLRKVLFDWIRLLGQGHRYTATGNSDSHKLFFVDPGLPRNLIHYGSATSDAADVTANPKLVLDALKAGRVIVTSGPILDVDIDGKGPGEVVRGGSDVRKLHVRVRASDFVDVREVEILVGPVGNRVRWISVPASKGVVRLDQTYDLRVPAPGFVVVTAKGKTPLANVFAADVKPFAFTNPIWLEP